MPKDKKTSGARTQVEKTTRTVETKTKPKGLAKAKGKKGK